MLFSLFISECVAENEFECVSDKRPEIRVAKPFHIKAISNVKLTIAKEQSRATDQFYLYVLGI